MEEEEEEEEEEGKGRKEHREDGKEVRMEEGVRFSNNSSCYGNVQPHMHSNFEVTL